MTLHVGEIRIDRVIESEGPDFPVAELIPDATPESLAPIRHWAEPRFVDPASRKLVMTMQSYVLRTGRHTIVVDGCVGNDKPRRFHAAWNMRTETTYLDNLAKAGVRPEEVTHVMCTHLHPDHVGWNTRLLDGRWVPTFPNARYVFARQEWEHFEGLYKKHGAKTFDGCIHDSVLPVIEAGRADLVASDYAFDDGIWFEAAPGHTPGHIVIHLKSGGALGAVTGDVIHSPIQCAHPDWSSAGCADKALSARTRRAFLEKFCESRALVMPAHFPSPSAGYVEREGAAFRFRFVGED